MVVRVGCQSFLLLCMSECPLVHISGTPSMPSGAKVDCTVLPIGQESLLPPLSVCQMHQHTHDFPLPTGNVVEARWGTIASAIPEVLRVEKALRYGWDINKWGRVDPDLNSEAYRGVRVDLVDKVVVDPFWWGMLATLSFVAKLLDSFLFFTESCMCHAELIHRFGPAMKTGGPKLRKVLVVPHLSMEAVCLCLFLLKQK